MKAQAALVRQEKGDFSIEDVELAAPRPDEVLVKVVASGICHTDLAMRDGLLGLPLPHVYGHEGSGVVLDVGNAISHVAPGDHVVLTADSCGVCPSCRHGTPGYCRDLGLRNFSGARADGTSPISQGGNVIHGPFNGQSSFATHSVAAARSVVKVTKEVPLELLGPLGCGMQTGTGTVVNGLKPRPGDSLCVLGTGAVGLAAVMGGVLAGCAHIIAVDVRPKRLDLARELGASHVIDANADDPVGALRDILPNGADHIVECTGLPDVLTQALDMLAIPGQLAQVGALPAGHVQPMGMDRIALGQKIGGVVLGAAEPNTFIPYMIDLYRNGRYPFDKLIKFYDFKDINQAAYDSAVTGEVIKPVLRMP